MTRASRARARSASHRFRPTQMKACANATKKLAAHRGEENEVQKVRRGRRRDQALALDETPVDALEDAEEDEDVR